MLWYTRVPRGRAQRRRRYVSIAPSRSWCSRFGIGAMCNTPSHISSHMSAPVRLRQARMSGGTTGMTALMALPSPLIALVFTRIREYSNVPVRASRRADGRVRQNGGVHGGGAGYGHRADQSERGAVRLTQSGRSPHLGRAQTERLYARP